MAKKKIYAALDLGTNNCRLTVAVPHATDSYKFTVIEKFSRHVRLGEGLYETGMLSENAMRRATEAIKLCQNRLDNFLIYKKRFIATEACRSAKNGKEFLKKIYDETGLKFDIISRRTEAKYSVLACMDLIKILDKPAILFDIGGGSFQISVIRDPANVQYKLNHPMDAMLGISTGVMSLAEKFSYVQGNDAYLFDLMKKYVIKKIKSAIVKHNLQDLFAIKDSYLIGTSGTATTLASIFLKLEYYDRKKIDGFWLDQSEAVKVFEDIINLNLCGRRSHPCIGNDRAELVLSGCAILSGIMEIWSGEKMQAADRGLRDGILIQLMHRGLWSKVGTK